MNRYLSSFIITAFIYFGFIAGFLYYFNNPKPIEIKTKKSIESVKFTVIKQEKIEPKIEEPKKPEPIIEPEIIIPPIPIPKPTIKPKPIIKKDLNITIEKPKPIIKPKPIVKPKKIRKVIPKKIIKKKIIKKSRKTVKNSNKREVKKTQIKTNKSISKKGVIGSKVNVKKKQQQKSYYSKITRAINKNKSYPSKAKRREIEGSVKVKVILSRKGKLLSYKILSGKKVFKKSITKAIKNSFPLKPPKDIFSSNIEFSFTVRYRLY